MPQASTAPPVLNTVTLGHLARLADACASGWMIHRLQGDAGPVVGGMARGLTRADGTFLGGTDDVRDGYVWMTLENGMTTFWPVADLLPELITETTFINVR